MSEYSEKLKDPRWQKLRLEVMQRDRFRCVDCGRGDQHLNVHHPRYKRGLAPWEYPADELVTLCQDCHEAAHRLKDEAAFLLHQLKLKNSERIINALNRAASSLTNAPALRLLQAAAREEAEELLIERILLNLPPDLEKYEAAAIRTAIACARDNDFDQSTRLQSQDYE